MVRSVLIKCNHFKASNFASFGSSNFASKFSDTYDALFSKNTTRKFSSKGSSKDYIVESKYGPVEIPTLNLPQYVWKNCDRWADKPVATCGVSGRTFTFGETRSSCKNFANALLTQCGLKKGDVIALLLPNLPEFVVAIHGALEAGIIVTFVNPLYTAEEVKRQFENADVVLCVTIPQFAPTLEIIASSLPKFKSAVIINPLPTTDKSRDVSTTKFKVFDFVELITTQNVGSLPDVSPSQIAILPYSSGTTGLPKGVMLTHANCTVNIEQIIHPQLLNMEIGQLADSSTQETVLSVLPFFHIFGFNGILNTMLHHGAHTVTMPKFTPELYLNCLKKYRPTRIYVVPSLMTFLVTHPEAKPEYLLSVREILSGAAPCTLSLINKFKEKFNHPGLVVRQGYGMTEMSPCALITPVDGSRDKIVSAGQLIKGTQARIQNLNTGQDQPPRKSGELLIRGPQIMKGYWKNEKATKETLDSDGWLHTGDVAYYDEEGYFYIIDRTKELIKVKGNQVSPTELENLIGQIPGVADVAIVGIEDSIADEVPRAYVVREQNSKISEDDIIKYVEPKVVAYKRLKGGVKFVNAIPRNAAGKILRNELKAIKD